MNDIFITYRHFRLEDGYGEVIPHGGATLAFFVDLRDPDNRHAIAGVSMCSDKDLFCKEIGRKLAYRDLNYNRSDLKMYPDELIFLQNRFAVDYKLDNPAKTLVGQYLAHLETLAADPNTLVYLGARQVQFIQWCQTHHIF